MRTADPVHGQSPTGLEIGNGCRSGGVETPVCCQREGEPGRCQLLLQENDVFALVSSFQGGELGIGQNWCSCYNPPQLMSEN